MSEKVEKVETEELRLEASNEDEVVGKRGGRGVE